MSVRQLPHGVAKLISSAQVINSISSVVKELLENSIDAGASVIDIKLEKYGLDKIEVRDNGSGINKSDIHNVCLPNYTSKIYTLEDLATLRSYGFRGEALNSLCAVSEISITTRTESDEVASMYTLDHNGTIREVQSSHQMKGTIVTVTNLFRNVPVRRQFYESTRKAAEELKKIEKVVKVLAVIHPKLRVIIAHNKCLIWHKTSVNTLRQSLMQMYPHVILKNLEYFSHSTDGLSVEMLICKRDSNWSALCQPLNEAILFFVNRRPVKDKKVEKVVLEEMVLLFQSALPSNKCPLTLISIQLPPEELDVNLEPDKTKVFIKSHLEVLKQIRECIMLHFYKQKVNEVNPAEANLHSADEENVVKRRKIDSEYGPDRSNSNDESLGDRSISRIHDSLTESETSKNDTSFKDSSKSDAEMSAIDDASSRGVKSPTIVVEDMNVDSNKSPYVDSCDAPKMEEKSNNSYSNQRLSIEGNLVDDLFQSQLCENEEIYLENRATSTVVNGISDESLHQESNLTINCTVDVNNQDNVALLGDDLQFLEKEFNTTFDVDEKKDKGQTNVEECSGLANTSLTQTTLSQWSKGHVFVDNQHIAGGTNILVGKQKEEPVQRAEKNDANKNMKQSAVSQGNNLDRSVSSQMGRKDLAGLTNFARSVRPDIIKENPGISFTRVASELANRWRNLGDTKKSEYAEKAKAQKILKTTPAKARTLVTKPTLFVTTTIESIKTRLENWKQYRNSNDIRLISSLRTQNECLCRIGQTITVINVAHLQKNVLYHRYLCHSSIPLKHLDKPIRITAGFIGNELWEFLLSLERSTNDDLDHTVSICDSRIAKNGIKIAVKDSEVFVTEIARESPDTGSIENLVETLRLARLHKDLQHCRSNAIKGILKQKVVETCLERRTLANDEAEMLLHYWVKRMAQENLYSPDEPVCVKLHVCDDTIL